MKPNSLNLACFILLLMGLFSFGACAPQGNGTDRNVVVLLIDTLRRDRLGHYGYDKGLSPAMDRFAAEGFAFHRAVAPSSWTKPSVASLFTGLYPARHDAIGGPFDYKGLACALDPDCVTLAERFKEAGYRTAAFITNPHIIPQYHFDQGFDRFIQPAGDADALVDQALAWINEPKEGERFFVYLHLIDPHKPYFPPPDYRERFKKPDPGPGSVFVRKGIPFGLKRWSQQFRSWKPAGPDDRFRFDYDRLADYMERGLPGIDPKTVAEKMYLDFSGFDDPDLKRRADYLSAFYDGEVAYTDDAVGRFLQGLRDRGLYDNAVIVVTADHGEAFFEHGQWGHGEDVHAEKVDIPLLFHVPGPEGPYQGSMDQPVSLVDVYPTLADLLGLPFPADMQGLSLRPWIENPNGTPRADRIVFSEFTNPAIDHVAALWNTKKLIRIKGSHGEVVWRYYDLLTDPAEVNPLSPTDDDTAFVAMKRSIEALIASRPSSGERKGKPTNLPEEILEQLRALGY
jgi:arylsulfatase A-like enzyme